MKSEIDSLREINSKLLAEITELRKENAEVKAENIEVKAENVKLKHALEEHEARFTNLEQRDKEKTTLIAKLDDDIREIKQEQNESTVHSNLSLVTETSLRNDEIESSTKTVPSGNDRNTSEKLELFGKTVSSGNNQPRLERLKSADDSDEIELTKNQNIELDLIRDLLNCSIIAPPNEQHSTIKSSEASCNQVTTQNLIHLFQ